MKTLKSRIKLSLLLAIPIFVLVVWITWLHVMSSSALLAAVGMWKLLGLCGVTSFVVAYAVTLYITALRQEDARSNRGCAEQQMRRVDRQGGYTLIEIALVAAIIGLLISAVLGGQALLRSGEVQDIVSTAKDLSGATKIFKQRFRYLPGDFPVDNANPEIPNVSEACRIGGSGAGNGNGAISNAESACAAEHLIRSDLVRGDPVTGFFTHFGRVRLIATNDATAHVAGFPASVLNVVEMENIPCDGAMDIVRKLDTGALQTGTRVRASIASCTSGNVPFLAFAL